MKGWPPAASEGPRPALIVKYLTGEMKPQMPLGQPPLPAEQLALVRDWVAAGAKNDTPAEARETVSLDKPPVYTAASRSHRAGVFARWQDARRLGQSRNSAPHAGWQRAAQAPVRSLRAPSLAGLFQGRIAAGGRRRHARPLRRNSVMGCRIRQAAPLAGADRRYGVRRFALARRNAPGGRLHRQHGAHRGHGERQGTLQDGRARELGAGHGVRRGRQAHRLGGARSLGQTHRCRDRARSRKTSTCCAAN